MGMDERNIERLKILNEVKIQIENATTDNQLFDAYMIRMQILGGCAEVRAAMDEIDALFNQKFIEIGLAKLA